MVSDVGYELMSAAAYSWTCSEINRIPWPQFAGCAPFSPSCLCAALLDMSFKIEDETILYGISAFEARGFGWVVDERTVSDGNGRLGWTLAGVGLNLDRGDAGDLLDGGRGDDVAEVRNGWSVNQRSGPAGRPNRRDSARYGSAGERVSMPWRR